MSWPLYLPIHSYANIQVEIELKIFETLIGQNYLIAFVI